ncbi:MAG: hypothetical protein CUN49_13470 [Candidatus Thermofonsia Clade 1 bacterium]|jgi:LysM repeat protein|uniref:LysM domain-containing protein n=1 Tax=Candidatus Thermofonsia Clade 1 bacterium TaxID=2364210 RepID=A0A2M8PBD2_9CHLR|nr:MAG: hypothetical protein CUN49_13470 [Candidatus Thermofonsia Clade 1 bacterium]
MRRDAGSELVVALIAIGILALALVFGLVLTLSQRADAALTQAAQLQTPSAMLSPMATDAPSITPTNRLSQTPSPTESPSPRATLAAATRIVSASATSAPTATYTPSATFTLTPTDRPMHTQSLTAPISLSATRTSIATATHTPSKTRMAMPTLSFTPTPTPSKTRTATPTHTASFTLAPSATFTPSPTATPTLFVPTFPPELLTPTLTPLGIASAPETPCVPRRGWLPHTVQAGETLFSLARRTQISVAELARANCLANPSRLVVGSVIYVPRLPATATPIALIGVNIRNCGDPQRRMLNVQPDSALRGTFTILGTAQHENFQFYKVEIRADGSDLWQNLITRSTPIEGGVLAELDTALFPSGLYWLRLTVVDNTGNYPPPCEVRVILAP